MSEAAERAVTLGGPNRRKRLLAAGMGVLLVLSWLRLVFFGGRNNPVLALLILTACGLSFMVSVLRERVVVRGGTVQVIRLVRRTSFDLGEIQSLRFARVDGHSPDGGPDEGHSWAVVATRQKPVSLPLVDRTDVDRLADIAGVPVGGAGGVEEVGGSDSTPVPSRDEGLDAGWLTRAFPVGLSYFSGGSAVLLAIPTYSDDGATKAFSLALVGSALLGLGALLHWVLFRRMAA